MAFQPSPSEWLRAMEPAPVDVEALIGHAPARSGRFPSYRYKIEESRRVWRLVARSLGITEPLMVINDKRRGYVFAELCGVDHPRVYGDYASIDEIPFDELPDRFVLKSRFGSSNRGVKPLIRRAQGVFADLIRGREFEVGQLLSDQVALESEGKASRAMFCEELVLKPGTEEIADDWKFYCFDGVVAISMQRDLKGSPETADWRFKFRDREWRDLGPVKFVDRLDPDLGMPSDPEAMLAVAEHLSRSIGRAFLRIDLFESERGPLLGEFTPIPGPPEIFTPDLDVILGHAWEQAEARVHARSILSGSWDHLFVDSVDGVPGVLDPSTGEGRSIDESVVAALETTVDNLEREVVSLRERLPAERTLTEIQARRLSEEMDDVRATLVKRERELEKTRSQLAKAEYRIEFERWKVDSLKSRKWWRLGQRLSEVAKAPSTVLRLPVDVYRIATRPYPRPSRPNRDGTR